MKNFVKKWWLLVGYGVCAFFFSDSSVFAHEQPIPIGINCPCSLLSLDNHSGTEEITVTGNIKTTEWAKQGQNNSAWKGYLLTFKSSYLNTGMTDETKGVRLVSGKYEI